MAVALAAACDSPKSGGVADTTSTPDGTATSNKTLEAGDVAPDVEMTLHTGGKVKLSSLRGSKVFIWFYPKDDTPG